MVNMNIYIEKIALTYGQTVGVGAGIGAVGGGILSGSRTHGYQYNKENYAYEDKEFSKGRRVGNAISGAVSGGILGGLIGDMIGSHKKYDKYRQGNYEGSGRQYSPGGSNPHARTSHHDILEKVNLKAGNVKTKDEVNKAFRLHLHRTHPDKNPGNAKAEARFKDLSTARDALVKTDWFNKLAAVIDCKYKALAYMRKGRKSYKELAAMFNVKRPVKK